VVRSGSARSVAIGARILVPVARPASLDALLPVAAAMAAADDGHVVPLTVVPPRAPSGDVRAAADLATEAERRLRAEGVSTSGVVAEARSVPAGVRMVVASEGGTLVVMGWRGLADTSQAFDATVDDVVGRSSVPLLVVRPSPRPPSSRVVLPLTAHHVVPAGRGGLDLATTLARRLASARGLGVSLLWAGDDTPAVPDDVQALSDRLHHDPRRLDLAVGAMAQPGDVVITAVAPTTAGLREVTTHVTAATPDATLVVAIDPGPRRTRGLGAAVADAVPVVLDRDAAPAEHVVTVAIAPPAGATLSRRRLVRALTHLGTVSDVDVQWRAATGAQRLRVQVRLLATGTTTALGDVMSALHEAPDLAGASLHYDVERAPDLVRLDTLEPLGSVDP
jgi:hypothetical protein